MCKHTKSVRLDRFAVYLKTDKFPVYRRQAVASCPRPRQVCPGRQPHPRPPCQCSSRPPLPYAHHSLRHPVRCPRIRLGHRWPPVCSLAAACLSCAPGQSRPDELRALAASPVTADRGARYPPRYECRCRPTTPVWSIPTWLVPLLSSPWSLSRLPRPVPRFQACRRLPTAIRSGLVLSASGFTASTRRSRSRAAARAARPWACGAAATRALRERIGGRSVECAERDRDRYGRIVAVCQVVGADVNAWMVEQGWAVAYRRYSTDYVSQESSAKGARRGV